MVFTRWDPKFELMRAPATGFRRPPRPFGFAVPSGFGGKAWAIPLDIFRNGDRFTVQAVLPGMDPADIDVTIDDGILSIKAQTKTEEERKDGDYLVRESRSGKFQRSMRLPDNVDATDAAPCYENGVLTIVLPVAEAKKAKRLPVATGEVSTGSGEPGSG